MREQEDVLIIEQASFSESNLDELRKSCPARFEDCEFTGVKFEGLSLKPSGFLDCRFTNCNFAGTNLLGSSFRSVQFVDCNMMGISWSSLNRFENCKFQGCKL